MSEKKTDADTCESVFDPSDMRHLMEHHKEGQQILDWIDQYVDIDFETYNHNGRKKLRAILNTPHTNTVKISRYTHGFEERSTLISRLRAAITFADDLLEDLHWSLENIKSSFRHRLSSRVEMEMKSYRADLQQVKQKYATQQSLMDAMEDYFYRHGRQCDVNDLLEAAEGMAKDSAAKLMGLSPAGEAPECLENVNGLLEYSDSPILRVGHVYFLTQDLHVVYVGKTENLKRRISRHRKTKVFDRVFAIATPSGDLSELERRWIRRLKPKYNTAGIPS